MKLSLIVCIYNTPKEYFESSLKSVYHSTLKDFEVIVIDDGSTVDYSEIVKKYNPVYVKTENRMFILFPSLICEKSNFCAFSKTS